MPSPHARFAEFPCGATLLLRTTPPAPPELARAGDQEHWHPSTRSVEMMRTPQSYRLGALQRLVAHSYPLLLSP